MLYTSKSTTLSKAKSCLSFTEARGPIGRCFSVAHSQTSLHCKVTDSWASALPGISQSVYYSGLRWYSFCLPWLNVCQ